MKMLELDDAWDMIGTAIEEKQSAHFNTALIEVRNDVAMKNIALHNIAVILRRLYQPTPHEYEHAIGELPKPKG